MKALIQRVRQAQVDVDAECIGRIERGLLVLLGVEKHDDEASVARMVDRLLGYRIFADEAGKMNLSVKDVSGDILLVSQFTLAADTRKGARPSFSPAADPATAEALYTLMGAQIAEQGVQLATGRFGADMQVSLINDGPVTFLLEL